jgi:hypothetical protein
MWLANMLIMTNAEAVIAYMTTEPPTVKVWADTMFARMDANLRRAKAPNTMILLRYQPAADP